jgi:hypothetical protein
MQDGPEGEDRGARISAAQWQLFFGVLVIGGAGAVYSFLHFRKVQDSAALYIGLPLLLALGLSLTPRAKSALGATMKGITIALLLAAPILNEGYICLLFASPLFYLIGFAVGRLVDMARDRRDRRHRVQAGLAATLLALMALEGTTEMTSFPREHEVTVTKIVPASLAAVREALAGTPVLGEAKPFFLRIFPYPVALQGEGLAVGDTRRATFVAYKHIFWNRIEGDAVFVITTATDRTITFALAEDSSYVGSYVAWKESRVDLAPVDDTHTSVTWTLSFHRRHDPYWYFGTLQTYAVGLVAGELIDHAATPRI